MGSWCYDKFLKLVAACHNVLEHFIILHILIPLFQRERERLALLEPQYVAKINVHYFFS